MKNDLRKTAISFETIGSQCAMRVSNKTAVSLSRQQLPNNTTLKMKDRPMKTFATLTALAFATTFASQAQAQIQTPSGLLLGVYVQAVNRGMYVTSTIPGYSAVGRLQRGDILVRATAEGMPIYELRSLRELEQAKSAIGPNREAAVEFYRPNVGLIYAWVEFTPLTGPAAAAAARSNTTGKKQYGATFKLESEKPGARNLFRKGNSNNRSGSSKPSPGTTPKGGNPFDK